MSNTRMMEAKPKSETDWSSRGPLGPEDILHFLHIPKTAGRSVRAVLESYFDLGHMFPGTVLPDLFARPASEICRWRLFCGHYGRYMHRLLDREPVEITFLRDPIARSISHYNDLKTREGTWLHEFVSTHSFDEFVLDPVRSTELMNLQTRYLALDDIQEDYFGYSRQRVHDLPGLVRKYTSRELLDRALANLDAMAFVGLQERFDESLQLLSATFGWPAPREAPRHNTAKAAFDPSTISERAMERLREITALDQQVYDAAAARFEEAIRTATPEAREAAYVDAMASRPKLSRVSLGFERAILGQGWYARVREADGSVHRWTGPDTVSTLDLPLETGRSLRLRFRVGAQARDIVEELRVLLNGVELDRHSWQLADPATARRVFDLVLPAHVLSRQPFARIEFRVPRTITPAKVNAASEDHRSLGLYFDWLEIFPDERVA